MIVWLAQTTAVTLRLQTIGPQLYNVRYELNRQVTTLRQQPLASAPRAIDDLEAGMQASIAQLTTAVHDCVVELKRLKLFLEKEKPIMASIQKAGQQVSGWRPICSPHMHLYQLVHL